MFTKSKIHGILNTATASSGRRRGGRWGSDGRCVGAGWPVDMVGCGKLTFAWTVPLEGREWPPRLRRWLAEAEGLT